MRRSCSQDSKSKVSYEAKVILVFKIANFYKGVSWDTSSIESSQSLKTRKFSSSGKPNSRCEKKWCAQFLILKTFKVGLHMSDIWVSVDH